MRATTGRIVHYRDSDGRIAPAIITAVSEDGGGDVAGVVNLTVFPDGVTAVYSFANVGLYDSQGVGATAMQNAGEPSRAFAFWPPRD